jgi:hypothetical protein
MKLTEVLMRFLKLTGKSAGVDVMNGFFCRGGSEFSEYLPLQDLLRER